MNKTQSKISTNLKFVYSDNSLSIVFPNNELLMGILGEFNKNLKELENLTNTNLYFRGNSIITKGDDKKIQIIDVREDTERDHAHIKGTIHMKLSEIAKRYTELDKKKNIFVMCHTGTRSQAVCKWLKAQGYNHCVNVLGGIDAWAALIDRNIRRY